MSKEIQINISETKPNIEMIDYSDYVELNFQVNGVILNKSIIYDNTKLVLDKSKSILNDVVVTTNGNTNNFNLPLSNYQNEDEFNIVFIKKVNDDDIKLGVDIIVN